MTNHECETPRGCVYEDSWDWKVLGDKWATLVATLAIAQFVLLLVVAWQLSVVQSEIIDNRVSGDFMPKNSSILWCDNPTASMSAKTLTYSCPLISTPVLGESR